MSYVEVAARQLLDNFERARAQSRREMIFSIFEWKGGRYAGSIHALYAEQPQIVLVNKTALPLEEEVVKKLKEYKPDSLSLLVEGGVDFGGTVRCLRMTGDSLTQLTPEQAEYASEHPMRIKHI